MRTMPPSPRPPTNRIKPIAGSAIGVLFCELGRAIFYAPVSRPRPTEGSSIKNFFDTPQNEIYDSLTVLSWVCSAAMVFLIIRWLIGGRKRSG
jgi:hypothetical protein